MPKILVVEDNSDEMTSLISLLNEFIPEHELITARSGEEGIKKAREESPTTILLDTTMPPMDGFQTCKGLKSGKDTKHIPVILLIAVNTGSEGREKVLDCGADAFVTKPFERVELQTIVAAMLRIKKAEDLLRHEKALLEETIQDRTQELQQRVERYKTILDNATDVLWEIGLNGTIKFLNPAFEFFTGYSVEEGVGMDMAELFTPDSYEHIIKAIGDRLATDDQRKETWYAPFSLELEQIHKDGSTFPVEITARFLRDGNGNPIGITGITRDISERDTKNSSNSPH